jgi:hypothetical protein
VNGIVDLQALLASISPELTPGSYVFVAVSSWSEATALAPLGVFREDEAVTAICPRAAAERADLHFDGTFRRIVLRVHSSLQAVGFLAAVSRALAEEGIPCNTVSACYHDHIFVPETQAERALTVLRGLGAKAAG